MNIRSVLTTAFALATVSQVAFAQTVEPIVPPNGAAATGLAAPETKPVPRISFDGSAAGIRYRNQHNNLDKLAIDETQVLLDMQVALRLDKDNHWKIISRIKTGPSFLQPWVDTGLGSHPMNVNGFSMRQLYAEYTTNGYQADVGFMPVLPNAEARGVFAFAEDGWIDGARLAKTDLAKWAKRVTVTVGRIDDLNQPNLFKRGVEAPNAIIVNIQGDITPRLSYMLEGTQFNPSAAASEQYLRGIVNVATKDVVGFVDKVVVETLVQNTSKPIQGFAVGASKALKQDWSLTGTYSVKGKTLVDGEAAYAPRSYFYRQGEQVSLQIQKTLKLDHPIDLQLWLGKTIRAKNSELVNKNYGLINTKGLNVETRMKIRF